MDISPEEILADLDAWLRSRGFELEEDHTDTRNFGNRIIRYRREYLSVRVVSDRGQWFLDIAPSSTDYWFEPHVWIVGLDRTELPNAASSFAVEADLLRARLGDIVAARGDHRLRRRMEHMRSRRADEMFGISRGPLRRCWARVTQFFSTG